MEIGGAAFREAETIVWEPWELSQSFRPTPPQRSRRRFLAPTSSPFLARARARRRTLATVLPSDRSEPASTDVGTSCTLPQPTGSSMDSDANRSGPPSTEVGGGAFKSRTPR